eukprot:scaffold69270_cov22-Cyclotella_meneghiniana.AAC.6
MNDTLTLDAENWEQMSQVQTHWVRPTFQSPLGHHLPLWPSSVYSLDAHVLNLYQPTVDTSDFIYI